jgi:hypothetical protein
MSRDNGFSHADIDVGLFDDPKVRRLARLQRDPARTSASLVLYLSLVLESWADGDRLVVDDAAPTWFTDPVDDLVADLKAVELVDPEGRVKESSWAAWFTPAFDRRQRRRDAGSEGGKASWDKRRSSNALAKPKRRSSKAEATPNQSGSQADRPSLRAPARGDGSAGEVTTTSDDLFDSPDLTPEGIERDREKYKAELAATMARTYGNGDG